MLKALLIVVLAQAPDGGAVDAGASDAPIVVLEVDHGDLVIRDYQPDAGLDLLVPVQVGPGCYEPLESCLRTGKKEARDAAKIQSWGTADLKWVGVAFSVGAVVGAIITTAAILTVRK